jgi:hypothetical protein
MGRLALPNRAGREACIVKPMPPTFLAPEEIDRALVLLVAPDQAFEIRIFHWNGTIGCGLEGARNRSRRN